MHDEDDAPRHMPKKPVSLEKLSVADLERRIEELRAEIRRTEAELAKRSSVRDAAEALFRKRD